MTIPFDIVAKEIANALMSSNYKIEMYDDDNKRVYEKTKARKFFTHPGHHMITIHNDKDNDDISLKVFLSPPIKIKKFQNKIGKKLKRIATKFGNNMSYNVRTFGRQLTLKDLAYNTVKEETQMQDTNIQNIHEARIRMTGTSRSSYQKVGECRIIIRHTGRINEEKFGSRSRNIAAIYVETKNGERFRMIENSLHGARAMARHISNGGMPFDIVGKKITHMMEEMATLRDMIKEIRSITKSNVLSEESNTLACQIKEKYINLRETLKRMSGKVGYMTYSSKLSESERLYELTPKRWHSATPLRTTTANKKLPVNSLKGATPIMAPTSGGFTVGDKNRMKRLAASQFLRRVYHISADPTAPEDAQKINAALNSPEFKKSNEYNEYIHRITGKPIAEDEFDIFLGELEYDYTMEPESGKEKGPFDLETIRKFSPIKQLSLLMAEVLSPKPYGDPRIDEIKKEVESFDDETWNYWSRANDNLVHGDPLNSEEEKEAVKQAAHMFNDAGLGNFDEKEIDNLEVVPLEPWDNGLKTMEGKNPWGKAKSDEMHNRYHERMQKEKETQGKMKPRTPDKYDLMAKKYGIKEMDNIYADGNNENQIYCKKCGETHRFGDCPLQEAEAQGTITLMKKKEMKNTKDITKFDRPTKKSNRNLVIDLARDNPEEMHSVNNFKIAKTGKKQREYPLPEHRVLESWFNDMVRVEFFNEDERSSGNNCQYCNNYLDDNDTECNKCGTLVGFEYPGQENELEENINPVDAVDKLNLNLNSNKFDIFLNEYKEKGLIDNILSLVEKDSKLWKRIHTNLNENNFDVIQYMNSNEKNKLDLAFTELENLVTRRSQSLDSAIDELSKDFSNPKKAAAALHAMAQKSGLEKNDFGSTFADAVLSPNEEIQRAKDENKAEEFYGRAKFGEHINEDINRLRLLAGLKKKINEAEPPNVIKKQTRRIAGVWGKPETPELRRRANKAARRFSKKALKNLDIDDNNIDNDLTSMREGPYAIIWHGQSYEWYGDEGPESGKGRYKPKGDVGEVLVKNIPDFKSAQEIFDDMLIKNYSSGEYGKDWSYVNASDIEIVPMKDLSKHFHGYDPELQQYGAKPEEHDAKNVIDYGKINETVEPEKFEKESFKTHLTDNITGEDISDVTVHYLFWGGSNKKENNENPGPVEIYFELPNKEIVDFDDERISDKDKERIQYEVDLNIMDNNLYESKELLNNQELRIIEIAKFLNKK